MESQTRAFIVGIIREINPEIDEPVSDDLPLGPDGLEMESLGLVELLVQVEYEYGVKIPDDDPVAQPTTTLGGFVAAVVAHRKGASSEASA